MALKFGVYRLSQSVFYQRLCSRNISSVSTKWHTPSTPNLTILPLNITTNFKAQNPNTTLIDPTLVKIPKSILDIPFLRINRIIDNPLTPVITTIPPTSSIAIEDPTKAVEIQAARLIVIRRRKMRRHKLKKLRIKMKFYWAKLRQKREMKKEKEFQVELMSKIKEAEQFNASAFASSKIEKANAVLIPKLWKGKRLPEFVIKDLLVRKNQKMAEYLEKKERRKTMLKKVSDYNV